MFTIGDFARHGRVSVRMLRHYDAIGLLRPASVDPSTGYRAYAADQLPRLNRVVALKDLGFTLEQVASIIDDKVGIEELHGMLRLRRAELATRIAEDGARLRQVETRLRAIETEGAMPTDEVVVKSVPAVRVAELSGVARSFEPAGVGPVIGPLYDELNARLARAGLTPVGAPVAYYEDAPDGEGVVVHAALPVNAEPGGDHGLTIVDLPALDRAATLLHRGEMDNVMPSIQSLAKWIDANGYRSTGYNREVYLECVGDRSTWVTELQEPVTR